MKKYWIKNNSVMIGNSIKFGASSFEQNCTMEVDKSKFNGTLMCSVLQESAHFLAKSMLFTQK